MNTKLYPTMTGVFIIYFTIKSTWPVFFKHGSKQLDFNLSSEGKLPSPVRTQRIQLPGRWGPSLFCTAERPRCLLLNERGCRCPPAKQHSRCFLRHIPHVKHPSTSNFKDFFFLDVQYPVWHCYRMKLDRNWFKLWNIGEEILVNHFKHLFDAAQKEKNDWALYVLSLLCRQDFYTFRF